MVSIPQFNRNEVGVTHAPTGYLKTSANPDAFGASIAQANQNLGESSAFYIRTMANLHQQMQRTRALELSNYIDTLEKEDLLNPEGGYYSKLGKDAMVNSEDPASGANGALKNIEDKISKKQQELGLTWGYGYQMSQLVKTRKMDTLYRGATAHELKQTEQWATATYNEASDLAISKAVNHRDNEQDINNAYGNGYVSLQQKAKLLRWDSDTTRINIAKYTSDFHSGVLRAYINDGSLKATEYYNKHKNELLPEAQSSYLGAVRTNELKYKSRAAATELMGLAPAEAYKIIDGIENIDEQAMTRQFYNTSLQQQDRIKSAQQDQLEADSWNRVQQSLDINDIDLSGRPETVRAQMSYIEQMKKFGRIATDYDVYMELQDMSTYDAERFKTLNLNNYVSSLSEDEFKTFKERQRDIGKMEYSVIQDDNKVIDAALGEIGLASGKMFNKTAEKTAYSEIRSMVKEWETRHGQKINDSQLQDMVKSIGYQDPGTKTYTYKQIEKGMAEKVGFIKQVTNDMAYFEKVHKRPPSQEERHKIIYNRANDLVQDKNKETVRNINNAIEYTQPKQGETKELTFYADRYLPAKSQELGVKLTIVEGGRSRKANGKYYSQHSDPSGAKAADISMSEHTLNNRVRIVQSEINNPIVKKIGTSDPYILNRFKGESKIVDERNFDKKYGTNHANHIHVSLNAGNKNADLVRIKAPDGRIVLVNKSMVNQAIKNGGVRL